MSLKVLINSIDKTNQINWQGFNIQKNLTSLVDTFSFSLLKIGDSYVPNVADEVEILKDDVKIFGGYITGIDEDLSMVEGGYIKISGQDYTYGLSGVLVAKSYTNQTAKEIIDDLISEFAPDFTTNNVSANKLIAKIVFNQVSIADCLTRISKIIGYEWYVDENKDVHFFQRFSLFAPFDLTDTNGNYVYKSLRRTIDGSQVANQVKVRGGLGTESNLFEDIITVVGNETKSFKLPYKFSGLQIWLNDVAKTVGIDNVDTFTDKDVLYNYQMDSIRFENNLVDADEIKFAGYKKYPVMAIVSDDASIALIGLREKLIKDNTIESATVARERAFLELDLSKDAITDCSFKTYQDGLEPGMTIKIGSDLRGISDIDFIINKITISTRTPEDLEYSIVASTARKMGLTEFLKELSMRGDVFTEDDSEVAEQVRTDRQDLEIDETIEAVGASEDFQDLEISEETYKSDVEPIWVLAHYHPTDLDDPKRAGRLDLSFKLY